MSASITGSDLDLVARSITRQMRMGSRADKALLVTASQLENKTLRRVLIELAAELTAANWLHKRLSLVEAFSMQSDIFPRAFCQSLAGCAGQPGAYCLFEQEYGGERGELQVISAGMRLTEHESRAVVSL